MSIKIEKKIVGYDVIKSDQSSDDGKPAPAAPRLESPVTESLNTDEGSATIVQMHEKVVRPEMLVGSTYKIKTPISEHAFYITINDMLLNPGTPYEKRRPFEIFINSKNMDHYQWISGLTLIISAVFRKGGDVTFLVDELKSVFDPKGGYFKKGGRFMPSLVAEIGEAIESHLKMIGMIVDHDLDEHQQALVDQKRREYNEKQMAQGANLTAEESSFPVGSTLCLKCNVLASIMMDGCMTCLNCGDSKCG
ncbi:MAG: NrdJb [Gammaproteobacteria bacterium]|nr:NrdJb [Gammaproteobacteria bacterium]NKB64530.1 NrdJb [Gammaproteobacteria bacterium]